MNGATPPPPLYLCDVHRNKVNFLHSNIFFVVITMLWNTKKQVMVLYTRASLQIPTQACKPHFRLCKEGGHFTCAAVVCPATVAAILLFLWLILNL
jgi:hypothetical protein